MNDLWVTLGVSGDGESMIARYDLRIWVHLCGVCNPRSAQSNDQERVEAGKAISEVWYGRF